MSEISIKDIENKIYIIRGQKVMLDSDLADLYAVEVKRLNEQVKRNLERFPEDFMFQCNTSELEQLRSQIATAKSTTKWNYMSRISPYFFTEKGGFKYLNYIHYFSTIFARVKNLLKFHLKILKYFYLSRRLFFLKGVFHDGNND